MIHAGDPEVISSARFGNPIFVVRVRGGRVLHAATELRQLGWPVRLTQTGRATDFGTISAGTAGTTLCGRAFGYGSGSQPVEIGEDPKRGRCARCVTLAAALLAIHPR